MKYRTKDGTEYDLDRLNDEERKLFEWIWEEYNEARSWVSFYGRTARGIVEATKKFGRGDWENHPLYRIHLDLVANAGVKNKELRGELSDMVIDS